MFLRMMFIGCVLFLAACQHESFIISEGIKRAYVIFIPKSYQRDAHKKFPLVLDFHGSTSNPFQQKLISNLNHVAAKNNFIVVRPQGIHRNEAGKERSWNANLDPNGTNDLQFIQDLLDHLTNHLRIDTNRIYSTGFSGGARMTSRLACNLSHRIAAIAPVAGLIYPDGCDTVATRAMPILAFHGVKDDVNPYEINPQGPYPAPAYWRKGIEDSLQLWANKQSCKSTLSEVATIKDSQILTYRNCAIPNSAKKHHWQGHPLVLVRADSAGHTWPGSFLTGFIGPTSNVDASELIWDFFKQYSL